MLEQHLGFTDCPSIQVFNSPPSPNTVSEVAQGSLPVTVQQLYDLQDAMPLHWSPSASHSYPYIGKQRIFMFAMEYVLTSRWF